MRHPVFFIVNQQWIITEILYLITSCRCVFPIFDQPLLAACSWCRKRIFNEHHAWWLPSWVCNLYGQLQLTRTHQLQINISFFGGALFSSLLVFRTLLAGGMGSLMLDLYGWESMFYATGFLSGLWALIVWLFFLKGKVSSDPQILPMLLKLLNDWTVLITV